MRIKRLISFLLSFALVVSTTGVMFFANSGKVIASSLTVLSDAMSNENSSGTSTHLIKFKTPTALDLNSSGSSIVIAFPSGFDFTSIPITDLTMKAGPTTGLENTITLASSASTSAWGAAFTDGNCTAGKKCTLTLTGFTNGTGTFDIIANSYVTISYVATHATNPSSPGSYTINITTTSDAGVLAVPIISNDQVSIDATVAPTITFTNDHTTLHFGTLSSSAPQYANTTSGSASDTAGNTFTINTNAGSGYTLTYAAASTLNNGAGSNIDAATLTADPATTAGAKQFAMSAVYTNGSGGGTLSSAYVNSTNHWKFNTSGDTVVSTGGPVAGDTVQMHYVANISASTTAGVYTQVNTWIVTGNF